MSVNHNFTIAVTRYEYVNVYHTMTDWFNAFLMLMVFRKNPDTSSVLLIDSHPAGDLDGVWSILFGHVTQAGHLTGTIGYDDLIWGITGYNSPIKQHSLLHVPYLEEFREFFLTRFKAQDKRKLNCENLSILFIWRKNYVSHPRNSGGKIKRKIRNEMELLRAVQQTFPSHRLKGLQIDQLPMKEQLDFIDIHRYSHRDARRWSFFHPPSSETRLPDRTLSSVPVYKKQPLPGHGQVEKLALPMVAKSRPPKRIS